MKKEILFVVTAGLLGLAWLLDYLAGPIGLRINNPLEFVRGEVVATFPFTTFAVVVRVLALWMGSWLAVSFVEGKYWGKAAVLFFLGVLAELYAVQQLATNGRMTPLQWTVALAFTAPLLVVPILFYLVKGVVRGKPEIGVDKGVPDEQN